SITPMFTLFFNLRILVIFTFIAIGVFLTMFSFAANPPMGSWSIVASPDADTTRQNELNGVTCVSASDCWTVGNYYSSANAYQTLIEHWDGNAWTLVPSPTSDSTQTTL